MKIQNEEGERELQLKVNLAGAKPPIWRRLVVRERMSLADLHKAIQAAMGWLDCHLYELEIRGRRFTSTDMDDVPSDSIDAESVSLRSARLRRPGTKFTYELCQTS